MARINLLPWREEQRKEREKNFYTGLIVAVVCALLIFFVVKLQIDTMVSHQQSRNGYLQNEIKSVDKAITEIKDIQKKKQALLERMKVIQEFQSTRSDSVRLLDEIVNVLPEGVHLTSYKQVKELQTFSGVAQSNARVSAFMRNVDRSDWLEVPNLKVIKAQGKSSNSQSKYSIFTLDAKQITTQLDDDKEN